LPRNFSLLKRCKSSFKFKIFVSIQIVRIKSIWFQILEILFLENIQTLVWKSLQNPFCLNSTKYKENSKDFHLLSTHPITFLAHEAIWPSQPSLPPSFLFLAGPTTLVITRSRLPLLVREVRAKPSSHAGDGIAILMLAVA
jgi:hypothetical protein